MTSALFVPRDIGGTRMVRPIADALKVEGWDIQIAGTRGKTPEGFGRFPLAEFTPEIGGSQTSCVEIFLNQARPDVVISALGRPLGVEQAILKTAQAMEIPTVIYPDVWGAESRSPIAPTLALAFDAYEAKLVRDRWGETAVEIVGHPLVNELHRYKNTGRMWGRDLKSQKRVSVVLAGQGEYTREVAELVIASIRQSDPRKVVLSPQLHPKYRAEKWTTELESWLRSQQDIDIRWVNNIPTDALAANADITVSVYGTPLMVAMLCGHVPISVTTEATRNAMLLGTDLDYYPPAVAGHAIALTRPRDLDLARLKAEITKPSLGKVDTGRAVRAIQKLIR